jgi:hypothetical protein
VVAVLDEPSSPVWGVTRMVLDLDLLFPTICMRPSNSVSRSVCGGLARE